jgi:predicted lipoprotein with Yx(FWY)xxD motif
MRRFTPVLAALIALALLAGCGSSSKSSGSNNANAAGSTSANPYGGSSNATSTPATTPASGSGQAAQIKTAKVEFGTILVDSAGKTVYLFEKDKKNVSNCSGACAGFWPPVTTTGAPTGSSGASMSMLGTIKRADGTMQVTYAGHPLYYFVKDTKAGDTNGEGLDKFGAEWYALGSNGKKVEKEGS